MRPISPKLREQLSNDPFMERCVWTGEKNNVSWEHCWTYAGKQINERWAIVPLRRDLNVYKMTPEIKNYCRWVSLNRATDEELKKYPKKDWKQIKNYFITVLC